MLNQGLKKSDIVPSRKNKVYVGGENPRLSRLGGGEWERAKEKAKQNAKVIADRVLNLYKLRKIENNSLIIDEDTPWQAEIEIGRASCRERV